MFGYNAFGATALGDSPAPASGGGQMTVTADFVGTFDVLARVQRDFVGTFDVAGTLSTVYRDFTGTFNVLARVQRDFVGSFDVMASGGAIPVSAAAINDSRKVVFPGGTRVVAFAGGTRTVRF